MALIPPHYLDTVVSIHRITGVDAETQQPTTAAIATGFLVGWPVGPANDQGQQPHRVFFVTNRHVFQGRKGDLQKQLVLRFNTGEEDSHSFIVNLLDDNGQPLWFGHDDDRVDLAVLPTNVDLLEEMHVKYSFFHGVDLMKASEFAAINISTGDGLFVLGFPMGISGKARNFVIVRQGVIARVDAELLEEGFYYIDSAAFPGNSGGPVIHRPEVLSISGTQANSHAGLIGVVSAGLTYQDVAVSQQTGESRIVFTEQTGLVRVVPVERVLEVIEHIIATQGVQEAEMDVQEPVAQQA